MRIYLTLESMYIFECHSSLVSDVMRHEYYVHDALPRGSSERRKYRKYHPILTFEIRAINWLRQLRFMTACLDFRDFRSFLTLLPTCTFTFDFQKRTSDIIFSYLDKRKVPVGLVPNTILKWPPGFVSKLCTTSDTIPLSSDGDFVFSNISAWQSKFQHLVFHSEIPSS